MTGRGGSFLLPSLFLDAVGGEEEHERLTNVETAPIRSHLLEHLPDHFLLITDDLDTYFEPFL